MSNENLFLIAEVPGFAPQIGRLVSMMNYVRSTTLSAVERLGVDELDYQHDAQSNSIGALLAHIAAAEVGYQAATFHGRELNESERQEWGAALDLGGERAKRELRGQEPGSLPDQARTGPCDDPGRTGPPRRRVAR